MLAAAHRPAPANAAHDPGERSRDGRPRQGNAFRRSNSRCRATRKLAPWRDDRSQFHEPFDYFPGLSVLSDPRVKVLYGWNNDLCHKGGMNTKLAMPIRFRDPLYLQW